MWMSYKKRKVAAKTYLFDKIKNTVPVISGLFFGDDFRQEWGHLLRI